MLYEICSDFGTTSREYYQDKGQIQSLYGVKGTCQVSLDRVSSLI